MALFTTLICRKDVTYGFAYKRLMPNDQASLLYK